MSDTCNYPCTIDTCPLTCAQVEYLPSLAGNIVYAAIFGLLLIVHLGLGIRYKTWGFMVGMVCGLILEVAGYAGRILLYYNPFEFNNFIIYLVCLTIGPAFLAGACYLCLCRIIVAYGPQTSRFSPRTYAITFMTSDFISLVLQGAGGGLAATADTDSMSNAGRAVMVAGLVFQVVSLLIFMLLALEYLLRLRRTTDTAEDEGLIGLTSTKKFTWFKYALGLAVVLIFVRSVYRVAELQQGFDGSIANNEATFMVLEGPMIIIAVLALTILHPGIAFGGRWSDGTWSIKRSKAEPRRNSSIEEDIPLYVQPQK